MKKAAIIAGGKGTRLAPYIKDIPKALVKIGNKTIIEHQVLLLKEHGIKEIWVLLGYLGEQIRDYLGNGKKWKVKINYVQEDKPLGTAGALKQLEKRMKEDFLVFSGDVMLDLDLGRVIKWHEEKKDSIATFVVHPNDHPFDSDLVEIDKGGRIISLNKRPHPKGENFHNLSIASAYIFSPKIFKHIPSNRKTDIEKYLLPKILKLNKKVYGYCTPEYIKDAGTQKRLKRVREDYLSGKIKRLNLRNKRKTIFLDRDGVINKEIGQLSRKEDLKIYSFASKAIKKINDSEYLAIIITNQPMIAKGFMTEKNLNEVHKKLETELGLKGAKIDGIYYCPHHPEKGFKGEVPKLKINCKCRKPGIELLLQAKRYFNIDFKKSYFIGDRNVDVLAGKKAGCKTILVKTGYGKKNKSLPIKPDFFVKNLLEAVNKIT
ncbi:HAD-IIIA family hydrolase [Patescibacteria group bacterium]